MVFERIREIICDQLDLEEDKVTMDSDIMEDFEADSLDVVDLVMSIEDEFGLEVPDDQIENFRTVGDVVRYIEGKFLSICLTTIPPCAQQGEFFCVPVARTEKKRSRKQ